MESRQRTCRKAIRGLFIGDGEKTERDDAESESKSLTLYGLARLAIV